MKKTILTIALITLIVSVDAQSKITIEKAVTTYETVLDIKRMHVDNYNDTCGILTVGYVEKITVDNVSKSKFYVQKIEFDIKLLYPFEAIFLDSVKVIKTLLNKDFTTNKL